MYSRNTFTAVHLASCHIVITIGMMHHMMVMHTTVHAKRQVMICMQGY